MWDVVGLLTTAGDLAKKVLDRLWGDQTSQQASLQQRAEEAASKKHEALALLKAASEKGDAHAISQALSAVNGWDLALKRLHAEAAATNRQP